MALLDRANLILEIDSRTDSSVSLPDQSRQNAGVHDELRAGYVRKHSKRGRKTSRIFPPGASVLLAPMIKSIFQQTGLPIGSVELVAVTQGPGSFTGLRVGVVTAKALAYSIQAQIIGVNTLEVIVAQTVQWLAGNADFTRQNRICPVINAQRQQVFAGYYFSRGTLSDQDWRIEESAPNEILDQKTWMDQIRPGDVLTGPGLSGVFTQREAANPDFDIVPDACWDCTATTVGQLAWRQHEAGKRQSLWELEPAYFRPSAAEEVRRARLERGEIR